LFSICGLRRRSNRTVEEKRICCVLLMTVRHEGAKED